MADNLSPPTEPGFQTSPEIQPASLTIEDALRRDDFNFAERHLESYRNEYGETPHYLYFLARVKIGLKLFREANELLKTLYYKYPVFMADRPDYENFKREMILPKMEAAGALWKQILTRIPSKAGTIEGMQPNEAPPPEKALSPLEQEALQNDLGEAFEAFKSVVAVETMHVDALKGMILCATELGNVEEVMQYKARQDEAPKYWEGLKARRAESALIEAKKAFKDENLDLSNRILNLGLETLSDDPKLLVLKGEILLKKGMFREALGCVELVFSRYPNHSEAMRTRGKILAARFDHDFSRGQQLLAEADGKPTGSTAQAALAHDALGCFLDALNFDSANMLALAGVYRCHQLCNNPLKAHAALTRIKELDPSFKLPDPQKKKAAREEEFMPEPCFVATRIFGADSPETHSLRRFRDDRLRKSFWGRILIRCYARVGPALSQVPGRGPLLPLIRSFLRSFVRTVTVLQFARKPQRARKKENNTNFW